MKGSFSIDYKQKNATINHPWKFFLEITIKWKFMNKKKAIYIIGGGELWIKIIEWAREVGLKTIVTDKNPSSPGVLISDISINIDALDENEHINQVKILSAKYNIVGVYCQIESALLVRRSILSYLNLPTNSLKSLDISMNKELMKMCWLKESILTPEYRDIYTLEELSKFLNVREGNFVIKPTKGSGSRGVQSVNKHSNFENVYKLSMDSVAGDGHIIIEEKINGRSFDVNGIFIKGKLET